MPKTFATVIHVHSKLYTNYYTEFHSTQRGSSKKQATALAAMQMVRILYKAGMIEYFGEDVVSCEDRLD